jgi:hypothetical protein
MSTRGVPYRVAYFAILHTTKDDLGKIMITRFDEIVDSAQMSAFIRETRQAQHSESGKGAKL